MKVKVYQVSFIDLILIVGTQGWWALYVYFFKAVEVDERSIQS